MIFVKILCYCRYSARYGVQSRRRFFTKMFKTSETPAPTSTAAVPALNMTSCIQAQDMKMPVFGLGTWQCSPNQVRGAVQDALEAGYRHIDTSPTYNNQEAIGFELCRAFDRQICCRENLFITTKLPNYGMRAEYVPNFFYKSLQDLRLKYVDLFLINFPAGVTVDSDGKQRLDMDTCHAKIWQAMEDQVYAGYARAIGLSNFNRRQVEAILSIARVPPSNLQLEMNVYCQQREMVEYASSRGIAVCAYAPLGSPVFANALLNQKNKLPQIGRRKKLQPLTDPIVAEVARKHNVGQALVLLRYLLQLGVAVIPKSADYDHIRCNVRVFDFELDNCDMMALSVLNRGEKGRLFNMKDLEPHPEYPF